MSIQIYDNLPGDHTNKKTCFEAFCRSAHNSAAQGNVCTLGPAVGVSYSNSVSLIEGACEKEDGTIALNCQTGQGSGLVRQGSHWRRLDVG